MITLGEIGWDDFNSFAMSKTDVQVNVTLFKTSICAVYQAYRKAITLVYAIRNV